MKNDLSKVIMRFTYILIFITLLACFTLFFSYINVIEKEKIKTCKTFSKSPTIWKHIIVFSPVS